MRKIEPHAMSRTRLALIKRELTEEIRHLREAQHDLEPSADREDSIRRRQKLMDDIDRELAHRRLDHIDEPE